MPPLASSNCHVPAIVGYGQTAASSKSSDFKMTSGHQTNLAGSIQGALSTLHGVVFAILMAGGLSAGDRAVRMVQPMP
jgi:hypothetical protein